MADTTTELEVLDEIVDVLGGQSGQYETVVPVLQQIKELLASGITDPESIAAAVAAWLDEHPEATTTVQDGSITAIKLAQDVIGLIDNKADIDGYYSQLTAGLAENLIGRGDAVPAEYLYRTAGGTADIEDGIATVSCIKGNTLVWNQLVPDASTHKSGTAASSSWLSTSTFTMTSGHKYLLIRSGTYAAHTNTCRVVSTTGTTIIYSGTPNIPNKQGVIFECTETRDTYFVQAWVTSGEDYDFYLNVYDLTAMFGAGNEPATVAEFESLFPKSYYPYDAGSLLSVNMQGIEAVGFNQWDEEWELGNIDDSTGVNTPNSYLIRSKNYITAFPNTEYYARLSDYDAHFFCYDADYAYLGYVDRQGDGEFTTLANTKFMRFRMNTAYGTTYNHDICINLSWSGYRNGEYEEHWSAERPIDTSRFFPTGMKKAGSKADVLYSDRYEIRVGVVDLGTLSWSVYSSDTNHYFRTSAYDWLVAGTNYVTADLTCAVYPATAPNNIVDKTINVTTNSRLVIKDDSFEDDVDAFKASLDGVLCFYELTTPTVTRIEPPLNLNYKVSDFGTERIMVDETADAPQTAPVPMEVEYGINAIDTIRRLPKEYQSHKSMGQLTTALESSLGIDITETWDEDDQRYEYEIGSLEVGTDDIEDGSITGVKIADDTIPDAKLAQTGGVLSRVDAMFKHSKNLVDGNWAEGYYVRTDNGNLDTNSNYKASDYIAVEASTDYTFSSNNNNSLMYAFYDSSKIFISSGYVPSGNYKETTATTTAATAYVRFSVAKSRTNVQLEKGSSATYYEPYKTFIDPELVWSDGTAENVAEFMGQLDGYVTPYSTTFFHISSNLCDPAKCENGYYVNQTNGNKDASSTNAISDWIKVEPNTSYSISYGGVNGASFRYALYDAAKVFISGAFAADPVFTTPSNAAYLRLSYSSSNGLTPSMWMVAKASAKPAFEPYSNVYVLPQYVRDEDMSGVALNLPSKLYALVGYELNVYFDSLTENWERYHWDVTCSKGMQLERGFRVTPTADDVGAYTFTVTASLPNGSSASKSATLTIAGTDAGSGETASVIILGDSTTNSGIAVTKLNGNFAEDVMDVTTLGTRGTSPNMHEGRSGWTFEKYFTTAQDSGDASVLNPWYNPTSETFDASYYFAETDVAKPDWFFINLGINDMFGLTADSWLDSKIASCIDYCDAMIASVQDASPSTKIGVCVTIPPNTSQDAFGKAYKCGQTRDRYKRNNSLWAQALISEYDGRENEDIFLVPIHTALDATYNMGMESNPVNARNTSTTYQSPIANGGVHPVESGYWQIADVYTAFLKANA